MSRKSTRHSLHSDVGHPRRCSGHTSLLVCTILGTRLRNSAFGLCSTISFHVPSTASSGAIAIVDDKVAFQLSTQLDQESSNPGHLSGGILVLLVEVVS